ncbi:MAG: hypothetical protein DMF96_00605 [Acidobacteria bacterium]|nr:MAG: hypothetical protein DMF96_00605 [Acidobacteriota bacterium]
MPGNQRSGPARVDQRSGQNARRAARHPRRAAGWTALVSRPLAGARHVRAADRRDPREDALARDHHRPHGDGVWAHHSAVRWTNHSDRHGNAASLRSGRPGVGAGNPKA